MSVLCLKGSPRDGEPKGREAQLGKNDCYVTGSNADVAIMFIHDLFGWTFPNTRLLADQYAEEVDATVYVPDFFGGEVIPAEILKGGPAKWEGLPAFLSRNSKDVRRDEILICAKTLRNDFKRIGAIGFCYGGWGVFHLAGIPRHLKLVDCISAVHPSMLEKREIVMPRVPVQIMASEIDHMFTNELKDFCNNVIPCLGISYDYQYFPGLEHGFAIRGNPDNPAERKGMARAKNAAVAWFRLWLHGEE